eukprot:scaffold3134_cov414-Prasinococcus_capsulatus_cf.AAC.25
MVRDIVKAPSASKAPKGREVHAAVGQGPYYMRSPITPEQVAAKVRRVVASSGASPDEGLQP